MKVNLTYFKASGKYYSEGSYETSHDALWRIFVQVNDKLILGKLPGLVDGADKFYVLIDVPEHEHNHPHLCIPAGLTRVQKILL